MSISSTSSSFVVILSLDVVSSVISLLVFLHLALLRSRGGLLGRSLGLGLLRSLRSVLFNVGSSA
jgi:hypothetical protein